MSRQLTKKEKDFCARYVLTGNVTEAAEKAGFAFPEHSGARLLTKSAVLSEIANLKATYYSSDEAIAGLKRIAFSSSKDAVKLLLALGTGEFCDTENLDLFMVSEIKLSKGGGVEIKFFDRIKALGLLLDRAKVIQNEKSSDLISAITEGAENLNKIWSATDEI